MLIMKTDLDPQSILQMAKEEYSKHTILSNLLERVWYYDLFEPPLEDREYEDISAIDLAEASEPLTYYPLVVSKERNINQKKLLPPIGKSGVAIKITDEMVRYSKEDIVGKLARLAGKALARHKEAKIINYIKTLGTVLFDDDKPSASLYGRTTYRKLDVRDFRDAFTYLINTKKNPSTLLLHPLLKNKMERDNQDVAICELAKANNTSILISEFVPFYMNDTPQDDWLGKTDIFLLDKTKLGRLIVDEDLTCEMERLPSIGVWKIYFRERYSIDISDEGKSIVAMKNKVI